jgi:hypothetical protein
LERNGIARELRADRRRRVAGFVAIRWQTARILAIESQKAHVCGLSNQDMPMSRSSRLLPFIGVLISTGCLAAAPVVGGMIAGKGIVGAVNASNRAVAAKMTFDSVTFTRANLKGKTTDSVTVRGMVMWHPARRGETVESNSRFFALNSYRGVNVELVDKDGQLVTTIVAPLRAWDDGSEIAALPPDKTVRFEIRTLVANNILGATNAVRIKEIVLGQSMATP